MRVAIWMTIFSTCLIGVAVDSVIIRDYRASAKLAPGSILDHDAKNISDRNPRQRSRRKTFRPSRTRCCNIGYKVAKRKLTCDVLVLQVVRKYNDLQRAKMKYNRPRKIRPSKISAKLSIKLGKCLATYPQFFENCCKHRDQYYMRLTKCKQRPRRERQKCRHYVRKRFEIIKTKRRKRQRRPKAYQGRRKA